MHLSQESRVPFSIKARGADSHYWGSRPGIAKQIVAAAQAANGLLAVSEALPRDMAPLGMPARTIRVHYTGIDLDRFQPSDRRAAKARHEVKGPLRLTPGAPTPPTGQWPRLQPVPPGESPHHHNAR